MLALALCAAAALIIIRTPCTRQWIAGLIAVACLALLFLTPLCALAVALFSARTGQHLAIILLVCPLLAHALGTTRRGLGVATAAHVAAVWAWHLPPVYALALQDDAAYWLLQLALILSGAAFWRALFGAAILPSLGALAAMMVQMGVLGALLTFAPVPLYAPHAASTVPWGISPLADQQLSGLMMWVLSLPAYLLAAIHVARPAWQAGAAAGAPWRS